MQRLVLQQKESKVYCLFMNIFVTAELSDSFKNAVLKQLILSNWFLKLKRVVKENFQFISVFVNTETASAKKN